MPVVNTLQAGGLVFNGAHEITTGVTGVAVNERDLLVRDEVDFSGHTNVVLGNVQAEKMWLTWYKRHGGYCGAGACFVDPEYSGQASTQTWRGYMMYHESDEVQNFSATATSWIWSAMACDQLPMEFYASGGTIDRPARYRTEYTTEAGETFYVRKNATITGADFAADYSNAQLALGAPYWFDERCAHTLNGKTYFLGIKLRGTNDLFTGAAFCLVEYDKTQLAKIADPSTMPKGYSSITQYSSFSDGSNLYFLFKVLTRDNSDPATVTDTSAMLFKFNGTALSKIAIPAALSDALVSSATKGFSFGAAGTKFYVARSYVSGGVNYAGLYAWTQGGADVSETAFDFGSDFSPGVFSFIRAGEVYHVISAGENWLYRASDGYWQHVESGNGGPLTYVYYNAEYDSLTLLKYGYNAHGCVEMMWGAGTWKKADGGPVMGSRYAVALGSGAAGDTIPIETII